MAKAFFLADKLQDIRTENLIVDSMIQLSEDLGKTQGSDTLDFVFSGATVPTSSLRKMIIDLFAHITISESIQHLSKCQVPVSFAFEVLQKRTELEGQGCL